MNTPDPLAEQAFQVVAKGDTDALIELLKEHPSAQNGKNPDGVSLLLFAVYNNKMDIADLLVKAGVEFDVFSASGYGALREIMTLLENEPALVNTFSQDGWTPLHLASFFGHIKLVEYLVISHADVNAISRNDLRNTPLNAAAASNKSDIAKLLLKKSAEVNFAQQGGITPLHTAAHNGNEELVRILLAEGAERNAKDEKGETPIDKATQRGHMNVVSILRSS